MSILSSFLCRRRKLDTFLTLQTPFLWFLSRMKKKNGYDGKSQQAMNPFDAMWALSTFTFPTGKPPASSNCLIYIKHLETKTSSVIKWFKFVHCFPTKLLLKYYSPAFARGFIFACLCTTCCLFPRLWKEPAFPPMVLQAECDTEANTVKLLEENSYNPPGQEQKSAHV